MSYMQEVEQSLKSMLTAFAAGDLSADAFIRTEKARMLESYRNGIEAGKLHAHGEGVKAIENTFHPSNENGARHKPRSERSIISDYRKYMISFIIVKTDGG